MTNPNSDPTLRLSANASNASAEPESRPEDVVDIQEWIDHDSWDPLGGPQDGQACWDLLSQPATIAPSQDAVFAADMVNGLSTGRAGESMTTPRFIPKKVMGIGGFGAVISVYDRHLQRMLALKIMRPSLGKPRDLISRFVREARAVAAMEHPGIVRVFETGIVGGQPYLAMELVDGPNLARFMQEQPDRRLPLRQGAWLMSRIVETVQFAHSRGVLHRDLKPSNILLAASPEAESYGLGLAPRLTDFGLAKRIDIDADRTRDEHEDLTDRFQILGTIRYMSPEQASGRLADVAIASDIFSLGVILYQLLTGRLPFDASTNSAVIQKICTQAPTRPRKLRPDMPLDLEAILLKALAKNPAERYLSAGAMQRELERFLQGEPVEAANYSHLRLLAYQLRRHPFAAAGAGLSLATIVTASSLVTRAWYNERAARAGEAEARRRESIAQQQHEEALNTSLYTLNDIFFNLAEKLNNGESISNGEQIRLLEKALEFHRKYVDEAPFDVQRRHRLSISYHHLANAHQSRGRFDRAIPPRKEVIRLLDGLLLDRPGNPKLLFQKAVAHFHLSCILQSSENAAALESARVAESILLRLSEQYPDDKDYTEVLLSVRMETCLYSSRDIAGKEQALRQAIEESIALWESTPHSPRYGKHAVSAAIRLATLLLDQGKRAEAFTQAQSADVLFERIFAPIRNEDWVQFIERLLVREYAIILLKLQQWPELEKVATRGYALEELAKNTEPWEVERLHRLILLRCRAAAVVNLKRGNEATEFAHQIALLEEQIGRPSPELRKLLDILDRAVSSNTTSMQTTANES